MTVNLLSLAARNVFRQRGRSTATLFAIAVGVAGLILAGGFVQDIFIQLGEAIIHSQSGHIQITREGYHDGKIRAPEAYLINRPNELKQKIQRSTSKIHSTMARLNFSGILNNGKRDLGIIGEGIEPKEEANLGTYLNFVAGRALRDSDLDGVCIGQGVARSLGLKIGDRVTLAITLAAGAINTLDVEVIGIFQSFSKEFDSRAVRISLDAAKSLMDTQAAHMIVITLDDTRDTESVTANLKHLLLGDKFQISPWNELSDFYEKTINLYDRQFGILRLIIMIMVLLSVVNSVNMTLFERTREFGTMLATGDGSEQIFRLILAESVLLAFSGALLGMTLGCTAAFGISAIGIPMPPPPNANLGYIAQIRIVPSTVLLAGAIGFIATVAASILPAKRASKLSIVDALRHGV
jgi:putative ABC transport system permease protein